VVLESGLGLESELEFIFAGLGLACHRLRLGLGLGHPEIESFFKSPYSCNAITMRQQDGLDPATAAESVAESNHMDLPTPPPNNMPKLFAGYKSKMSVTPGTTESVADVLGRYLSDELDIDTSCRTFWHEHPSFTICTCIECTGGACLQPRRHLHETT